METRRNKREPEEQLGIMWGGSEVLVLEPIAFRDDITIKVDGGVLLTRLTREGIKGNSALCRE